MSDKIKPCPFCGTDAYGPNEAILGDSNLISWWIECKNKECQACIERCDMNEVIEAWNMRTYEELEDRDKKLNRILTWCDAYPLDIFPEPDFDYARELLEAGGIKIDAISASNMRHVLNRIKRIIEGDK